jgi:transketolase
MAAGLAMSGRIVFTYSIANFPILRCLEQIRNDICYHKANVKIVAVGGGMAYGSLGMSHHATEDIAIARALPGIDVLCTGDPIEAETATKYAINKVGPVYLRIGRAGEPFVHHSGTVPNVFGVNTIRLGKEVLLISTGGGLSDVVRAAEILESQDVSTHVCSVVSVKPLDKVGLMGLVSQFSMVFTVEEHSTIGGLGGGLSELIAESGKPPRCFGRIGLADEFSPVVGDQAYLRKHHGLDPIGIANRVMRSRDAIK